MSCGQKSINRDICLSFNQDSPVGCLWCPDSSLCLETNAICPTPGCNPEISSDCYQVQKKQNECPLTKCENTSNCVNSVTCGSECLNQIPLCGNSTNLVSSSTQIPTTTVKLNLQPTITIKTDASPALATQSPQVFANSAGSLSQSTIILISVVASIVFVIIVVIVACFSRRSRKKFKNFVIGQSNDRVDLDPSPRSVPLIQLPSSISLKPEDFRSVPNESAAGPSLVSKGIPRRESSIPARKPTFFKTLLRGKLTMSSVASSRSYAFSDDSSGSIDVRRLPTVNSSDPVTKNWSPTFSKDESSAVLSTLSLRPRIPTVKDSQERKEVVSVDGSFLSAHSDAVEELENQKRSQNFSSSGSEL
ncbi:hypothetical protein HK098_005361 [Nowakowskiella sp. JEL0407]|nr:hypothetical protein HK098_005361 [Nowakowskiella sp. JEL0407]